MLDCCYKQIMKVTPADYTAFRYLEVSEPASACYMCAGFYLMMAPNI